MQMVLAMIAIGDFMPATANNHANDGLLIAV